MDIRNAKIVFYDGECGFCNRSVAFVLKNDKTKSILFASIQSAFAQELFIQKNWSKPNFSTFYFLENGQLFEKSTAGMKVSQYFSFPQSWLRGLIIIPRFLRDVVYDFVAIRRHRLSKGYCFAPNEDEKKRFLD